MNLPLISVIIPLYNADKYIGAAINSVLAQTQQGIEIIIIDDGSTDNSLQVAKTYERYENVKVYACDNAGACAARNFGFAKSKGEYIQYLDADDLLAPDKIERQYMLLQQAGTGYISSCAWAHFTETEGDAVFVPQLLWQDMKPVDWLIAAWTGGGMMQTACWLTPRTLLEAAGSWDESLPANPADDGEFFCRVILKSKGVKFQPSSKVYYRKHTGIRVSSTGNRKAVSSLLGTYVSYEKSILQTEKSERIINALANNYASFMVVFFDTYPDLAKEAEKRIQKLGLKKVPLVGGDKFKQLQKITGFKRALYLRFLSTRIRRLIDPENL